jgi:2-polyprenyl-6-hydroxyphenyl methylase/3-demethylubiquinone-9 3-methyltransferase
MSSSRTYEEIWARKATAEASALPVDRWAVVAAEFVAVERLLDIGCGDGRGTMAVRAGARVIAGTDIAGNACRVARRNGLLAVAASLDRGDLPFAPASFDAVTCLDVIEHVLDPTHLMREIARVLRRGGRAYVTTVNMRYAKHLFQLVVGGTFPRTSSDTEAYDGGHLHYFTARNLLTLGRDAGLERVRHVGVVPSARLRRLQPLRRLWPVREFLAAGFLLVFTKP